jgi:hypothetical protein
VPHDVGSGHWHAFSEPGVSSLSNPASEAHRDDRACAARPCKAVAPHTSFYRVDTASQTVARESVDASTTTLQMSTATATSNVSSGPTQRSCLDECSLQPHDIAQKYFCQSQPAIRDVQDGSLARTGGTDALQELSPHAEGSLSRPDTTDHCGVGDKDPASDPFGVRIFQTSVGRHYHIFSFSRFPATAHGSLL